MTLFTKYGDVFRFDMMGVRGTIVNTPALVEHVTKTKFECFAKGPLFQSAFKEFLGTGIFNSDGPVWKVQRKTASHMFNVRNLRDNMSHVFAKHTRHFLVKMETLRTTTNSFDIQNCFYRFTLDSICEVAFSHNLDSLNTPNVPFAVAFDQASRATDARVTNPLWKVMPFLPSEIHLQRSCVIMREFTQTLVTARRQHLQAGAAACELTLSGGTKTTPWSKDSHVLPRPCVPQDILTKFMLMETDEGQGFSDAYLQDFIVNFILAGRDTTAVTMSWMTYLLCTHPSIQQEAVEEITTVLQGHSPSFENVKELSFLSRIIHETLRLYPSVPIEMKTVMKDDVLPTGHSVKQGEMLFYSIYALNRRPDIYPNPDAFQPDRWIDFKPSAFEYPTFNAGPRTCLGKEMALLEIKMLMSALLQRYELTLSDPLASVTYEANSTLPIRHGLHVRFNPRDQAMRMGETAAA